jgi:hypothetical protein
MTIITMHLNSDCTWDVELAHYALDRMDINPLQLAKRVRSRSTSSLELGDEQYNNTDRDRVSGLLKTGLYPIMHAAN